MAHIQIILRDDIRTLGKSGDLIRVKAGYARNFLIPRGMASVANAGNVAQVEHEKRLAVARGAKLRAATEDLAKGINGTTVTLKAQAGDEGKLFGSIGTKDIASALKATGKVVDKKNIVLPDGIRALGEYDVAVKLGYDIAATIKVNVVKQ